MKNLRYCEIKLYTIKKLSLLVFCNVKGFFFTCKMKMLDFFQLLTNIETF